MQDLEKEDLTKSGITTVRWQAQMEEDLKRVRELTRAGQPQAALAHGLAALTLSISLAASDVQSSLTDIQHEIARLDR